MTTVVSPSILAFVTTMHLALVVLRAHRSASSPLTNLVIAVSVLFAASPWLMPTVIGLATGAAAQGAWFVACEHLLLAPAPAPAASASPTRRVSQPAAVSSSVLPAPKAPVSVNRRTSDFVPVPVMATYDESRDIRTIRMARPEGFDFVAGQFLTVRVRADGREHVRCYSISSAPGARGYLEISVKRLGLVSGTLHATVRPGSTMTIKSPAGAFTYPADDDRPIVLVAGGVGITPLMSMLRHAVDSEPTRPVTLLYSVRTAADLAFDDELQFLRRRHAQFRPVIAVTEGPMRDDCHPGFITAPLIRDAVPHLVDAACFVCGPPPMMTAMTALLEQMGVPKPQIHTEVFQAAVAASGGATVREVPRPTGEAVTPIDHVAAFDRSGVTAAIAPGQSLLEAGEACGAAIPSLCRAGVCGTCRTRVTEGDVRCASRILDERDRADGFVLPCVSHAHSDCRVDA